MTFQFPSALFAILPIGGFIVFLYLLKMRRRDVRVPASFLWPNQVEEIRANALIQKLRPNILLFLQLLALLAIVGAVARPQTAQKGLAGEVTVLVIDTSASMSATDVKPNRFEEAKRLAREAIQSAKATDRIAIIEAGPTPRVISPLSNDPARQLAALNQTHATDAEGQVGEALRLASALVASLDGARIVLLSDGNFEPVSNFSRGKAALVYRCIGNLDDNMAINALGTSETPAGRQLFCGIKNHGSTPNSATLNLYADGKLIDSVKAPVIGPNGQWGRTIPAPAGAKVFEAKIDCSDYLKSDNYAVDVTDPTASLRVLLITKGNLFLERALALDPRVTLDKAMEVPVGERSGTGAGSYDVVVFDNMPEQPVKARGVLTFGLAGPESPVTASGASNRPKFLSAERSSLMENVDLASVYIDRQTVVKPKGLGETLAQTSVGPLVVASKDASKRQIFVAFAPLESDFPLQVGFPIFVANALDFLSGSGGTSTLSVRTGQTFSLPITTTAHLTTPNGDQIELKPNGSNLVVRDLNLVGAYKLSAEGKSRTIYASLKSDRASTIKPQRGLNLGGGTVKANDAPLRFADFWRPLALLILVVLVLEWWIFARKS